MTSPQAGAPTRPCRFYRRDCFERKGGSPANRGGERQTYAVCEPAVSREGSQSKSPIYRGAAIIAASCFSATAVYLVIGLVYVAVDSRI